MRLAEQHRELRAAFGELRAHWEAVRRQWNDAASQQFERGHWNPLESAVLDYLTALEDVAATLEEAEVRTR